MISKPQVAQNLRATRGRVDTADPFRLMAEWAPVMIWLADRDGRSVYFNRRWLEFRGRKLEDELGMAWIDGVHPDDRDQCVATHFAALQSREPFQIDVRLRRADGEHRHVSMNGSPIIDGDRLGGFVGSCVEAATLARDQFLAIVSHELRSPLNGIKSWTHVLENQLQESDDPTVQRAIAGIMIGVEQQVRLIDDLLDVTRAGPSPEKEAAMAGRKEKRTHADEEDQHRTRDAEHPQRPEPDTLEGPGGRHESKGEEDAINNTTRRGER